MNQKLKKNFIENTSDKWIYTTKKSFRPGGRISIVEMRKACRNWRYRIENIEGLIINEVS